MPTPDGSPRVRRPSRSGLGSKILGSLVTGASVEDIAKAEGLAPKRVEKLLRDELQRRWLAPAQDYARLQIARLEPIYAKLKTLAEDGDLRAIDKLLRVLDRLDRYHSFGKRTVLPRAYDESARQKLLAKLSRPAGRMPATPKGDA
jgi:hypothetical protein